MNSATESQILIIHDDARQAEGIARALADAGYGVSYKGNSVEGLIAVEDERPALVLLDWSLPFIDGSIFIRALSTGMRAPPPVVALTPPDVEAEPVLRAGASACLAAPLDGAAVVRVVRHLLGRAATVKQRARPAGAGGRAASPAGRPYPRRCAPASRRAATHRRVPPSPPAASRPSIDVQATMPRAPWGLRVVFHSPAYRRAALGVLLVQQLILYIRLLDTVAPSGALSQADLSGMVSGAATVAGVLAQAAGISAALLPAVRLALPG